VNERTLRCGLVLATALAGFGFGGCSAPALESPAPVDRKPGSCAGPVAGSAPAPVTRHAAGGADAAAPPAWCRAVGPALVEAAGSVPADAVDALIVASWNIRAGAGDVPAFVGDLRSGSLTGRPEATFVLLLQEAYRAGEEVPRPAARGRLTSRIDIAAPSGERLDVAELARRLDLHLFYAPSMPNGAARPDGSPEDRGNAILSTLPLEELTAIELPFEVQRRVAVAATVRGATAGGAPWRLRIASGHLDTRSRWSRVLDSFGAGRARQARALGESLEGGAVLLGADLNTWSAGFLEGAVGILGSRFPETPTFRGPTFRAAGVLSRRLDHLLARLPDAHRAQVRRIEHRYGSDHHPLLGVVRFHVADAPEAQPASPAAAPAAGAR
jgi:endonuclease/exonuclease/phosphatase family metal-dependent hydrolase